MHQTDRDWEQWGATDPFYGVLTDNRFRRASLDDHREDFFKSGDVLVDSILDRLEHSFGPIPRQRALDFGCGVGRLTQALGRHFNEVVGLDISKSMLSHAAAKPNIRYYLSDDDLTAATGKFSFVLTYIVLQHVDPSRGLLLIDKLLDRVEAGGGAMIHISTGIKATLRGRLAGYVSSHLPGARGLMNRLRGRPLGDPEMRMGDYPLDLVLRSFRKRDFGDVVAFTEDHGGILTVGFIGRRGEKIDP